MSAANEIHPTAVLSDEVVIGEGNVVGAYSVISGKTTIGNGNWIAPHVNIGSPPEDLSFRRSGEIPGEIHIGDENFIYEFTAVQAPTKQVTRIGSRCFIMDKGHVAHDCWLEDEVVLAPSVCLGGHCFVGKSGFVGMGASIHQYVPVGGLAMVAMQATVTRPVLPFTMVVGQPARFRSLNHRGVERADWPSSSLSILETVVHEQDPSILSSFERQVWDRWEVHRREYERRAASVG